MEHEEYRKENIRVQDWEEGTRKALLQRTLRQGAKVIHKKSKTKLLLLRHEVQVHEREDSVQSLSTSVDLASLAEEAQKDCRSEKVQDERSNRVGSRRCANCGIPEYSEGGVSKGSECSLRRGCENTYFAQFT